MKGSKFFKVTGILMIVAGPLSIILGIITFAAAALIAIADSSAILALIGSILMIVGAILELIAGIVGVKNCNKPEKARACMTWGIIVLVINVLSTILILATYSNIFFWYYIVTVLVIPVLYLIGAVMNKKAA